MSTKSPQGLVAHAKAQLGLPYFYGTYGQRPTTELINQKQKQYPQYWSQVRVDYAKAHYLSAPRVYDCAGIVKSYWMQESPTTAAKYVEKYDKSAGGLKSCCAVKGPITSIPEQPGLLVFVGTRHVGVYAGNGKVIEAKGFDYGVVESDLKHGSWDTWGKLDWLSYAVAPAKPSVASDSVISHVVKAGDTLWALASRYLGSGTRWQEIQALNGGIDPKKLRIGMALKIPERGSKK
jgi:cell wall-associated NlpC family hydrolase